MAKGVVDAGNWDPYATLRISEGAIMGDLSGPDVFFCQIINSQVSRGLCAQESQKFSRQRDFCGDCKSPLKVQPVAVKPVLSKKNGRPEYGQIAANACRGPRGLPNY